MSLHDQYIDDTYKDVVQLNRAGAGLATPYETPLFDGYGNQILGRTAVRHWLDPHPDAASFDETWEFSTTGDMTQAQLEAAGWTFENCTAEVSGGILWLTSDGSGTMRAWLEVNFTGDFDIIVTPAAHLDYADDIGEYSCPTVLMGACVGRFEAGVSDVGYYHIYTKGNGGSLADQFWSGCTWSDLSGGAPDQDSLNSRTGVVSRAIRDNGGLGIASGDMAASLSYSQLFFKSTTMSGYMHFVGWTRKTFIADATTINRFGVTAGYDAIVYAGTRFGVASIRRFK